MELCCTTAAAPPLPVAIGTVYGALLNERAALAALGDAVHAAPYGRPPQAPVLYIKPANTHASDGAAVVVPAGVEALEIGASVAVVFARRATRVPAARALDYVHGFTLASDVSVPHPDYYRPAVRFKCRDGFCPLGPAVVPAAALADVDAIALSVRIDGEVVARTSTATLIRPVRELIADISAFMSFDAGDVLLLGVAGGAPHARAGSTVEIAADGIGTLRHTLVAEAAR
ncbi:fumarylacetoacetate hydrolase family protein [Burkholderia multivorans]|uniref:4-hydroxyphenylacetate degradation bifunctional isomerase/decarboxylase, N-subunit n=2 Tax=Burkholderia multivorans TaxID=87883 RepID=B9BIS4_9BURK|nr:fumarylacetoacetate hydrolase family protein [Burkholderia multivorans]EEE09607.1 4-hydroxyphenylacetate degradation bifunctional isomerase/decarboxylase, N- subunit [Burkholderia multivorans CGD2]EEE15530.1 4-hydroxyphenylacetate degradation bifunctional isomerase/decarboxylase, N- subunit [Burkholderia multivorans CGD2M]MBU9181129.1 fumarylacetoacetate hydrolase family protein [Burkholderia multivorans]MBU9313831.1 fumarylacetoacetate hydrolase family protein [Burkholderia multivorans]MBU